MDRDNPNVQIDWVSQLQESVASARKKLEETQELIERVGLDGEPVLTPVQLARSLYKTRRIREQFLSPDLFADPAWDILLDLYAAHHEGRTITISGACIGANVPATTGLRWLEKLEKMGIISRRRSISDDRMVLVSLTQETIERMTDMLLRISDHFPGTR